LFPTPTVGLRYLRFTLIRVLLDLTTTQLEDFVHTRVFAHVSKWRRSRLRHHLARRGEQHKFVVARQPLFHTSQNKLQLLLH
jgi:hypothetical protein